MCENKATINIYNGVCVHICSSLERLSWFTPTPYHERVFLVSEPVPGVVSSQSQARENGAAVSHSEHSLPRWLALWTCLLVLITIDIYSLLKLGGIYFVIKAPWVVLAALPFHIFRTTVSRSRRMSPW